jgi:hypothetical protein
MKKRVDALEGKIQKLDPVQELKIIFRETSSALWQDKDLKKAKQARKKADPIFEQYPELRTDPPPSIGRTAYIDWKKFVNLPNIKKLK